MNKYLLAHASEREELAIRTMSRNLDIAVQIFWLVIVIGGGGWLFIRSLKASEDPARVVFKWVVSILLVVGEVYFARHLTGKIQPGSMLGNFVPTFFLVASLAACGVVLGVMWASNIGNIVAQPISSLFDGGNEPPEPKPYYSVAITKRKLNRPLEAVMEVRKQLAKFPDDFEGITLLANIQAEDMKDLPSAEITFNHFCDRPDAPPNQVAAAFTQMADWHLKIAQDVDSAREWLEKIIARFPETTLSLAAAQRIAHLGGTEKILLAAHDRQPVPVPESVKNIGLLDSTKHLIPAEADPVQLATDYVKHLQQHPHDTDAREKLAVIYADHYQRLDLATAELEQLIGQPNLPPKRVAHWLHLLANLQIRHGADYEVVRETLQKIVDQFPDLPVAQSAQSRLARLRYEINGQKETPSIKLGVYEQNIGLKQDSPRQL
jgi:tetratricopeptide (TPR) repeat protein